MKHKLSSKERKFLLFQGVFLIGFLILLFFLNSPNQIYPVSGMSIYENNFLFEIQNSDKVLLSDNSDFKNAFVLEENSEITLPPGRYYWKAVGFFRESKVSSFSIESNVALELKENEEIYELRNAGNVDVAVNNNGDFGEFVLTPGQLKDLEKDNSTYRGAQK